MLKKIGRIPIPLAAGIMVVLILLGITAGNKKALDQAVAAHMVAIDEIAEMTAQRVQKANNLLTIAKRYGDSAESAERLSEAISDGKYAKKAERLAQVNRDISFAASAVNDVIQAQGSEADKRLATGEMDELLSAETMIRRAAAAYNAGVTEVTKVYDKLPTKALLGGALPEGYQ